MDSAQLGTLFVRPHDTIRDVIRVIDAAELQIALVVDEDHRLLGTVTDGDVRRGLLRGVTLDHRAEEVMNRSPLVVSDDAPDGVAEALMKRSALNRIPVVDALGVVKDLALPSFETERGSPDNLVVLMAGGLGTRLGELTDDCPKPLLKVGPKPILETILERFVAWGFHRFLISVNYRADMIERYFGDGARWNVSIDYLRETKRLGTAGALSMIGPFEDKPVLVMNGDVLTSVDFKAMLEFHDQHDLLATMAVREYDVQVPFGVVDVDGHRLLGLVEKPVKRFFVNAGIYVLNPSLLSLIPAGEYFDMTTLFERVMEKGHAAGSFPVHEYWLDVGRVDDYHEANLSYAAVALP